jgi:hypothetical protein
MEWHFSLEAEYYTRSAGELLLVSWELNTLEVSLADTEKLQNFERSILADERNVATFVRAKAVAGN